jgi:Fur family ferric uptake transcriptional regulator
VSSNPAAGPAPGGANRTAEPRDAAARLRAAGLRVTRGRVAVVEVLERRGGHLTADEITRDMAGGGVSVPRASLYHALAALVARGVVLVADAGPGTGRYEIAGTWHHHLVCRSCGAIVDVPCLRGERPCLAPDLPGVVVDEAQVVFRGICAACAGRGNVESAAGQGPVPVPGATARPPRRAG